jgi:hypothetical protein
MYNENATTLTHIVINMSTRSTACNIIIIIIIITYYATVLFLLQGLKLFLLSRSLLPEDGGSNVNRNLGNLHSVITCSFHLAVGHVSHLLPLGSVTDKAASMFAFQPFFPHVLVISLDFC